MLKDELGKSVNWKSEFSGPLCCSFLPVFILYFFLEMLNLGSNNLFFAWITAKHFLKTSWGIISHISLGLTLFLNIFQILCCSSTKVCWSILWLLTLTCRLCDLLIFNRQCLSQSLALNLGLVNVWNGRHGPYCNCGAVVGLVIQGWIELSGI